MAQARSSFGKRDGARPQGWRVQPRVRASGADIPAERAPMHAISAADLLPADLKTELPAWIAGGITALLILTAVLSFGFSFGALVRGHGMVEHAISGFALFLTAGLAMAGAVYGGALMARAEARHNLRFAILLLIFAAEVLLFLFGEAVGKPKGVSWMLLGAIAGGILLWAQLRRERLLAHVAELLGEDPDSNSA